ncbi:DUF1707 domain-containing protein [Rhodococcus pseudokoreensis]|uniref:DUF1707 domain-containing protein n=1 Tax=Rhodococcus pseudokoreensis TaxID=2811421 RepID=A0A974W776_9NOCA|nr:DUF1707 domain-containing protein [Rhodococcus pseudokoreensis]QSE91927.1 DUF1707 domain-containing protein [Rhodococcus pseudokoreensis]
MASGPSSQTRARDLDRVNACSQLDAAYADGQLGAGEYHDRSAQAMSAKTLAELNLLISDLQLPSAVTEQAPVRTPGSPRLALRIVVACGAVIAVGAIGLTLTEQDGPDPVVTPVPAQVEKPPAQPEVVVPAVEPIIVGAAQPLTQDGIYALFEQYRQKFGDLTVHELGLYDQYAILSRTAPDAPDKVDRYDFRGGFKTSDTRTQRLPGTGEVDLAQVDVPKLVALIADAPRLVGVPDGSIGHVLLADGGKGPAINMYVYDKARTGGGYLRATLGGDVWQVNPAN